MANYDKRFTAYSKGVVTVKDHFGKSIKRKVYTDNKAHRLVMRYKGRYIFVGTSVNNSGRRGYSTYKI